MRSKFQLNEGEIQKIINLHKTAILKENGKNIINEENTVKIKTQQVLFTPAIDYLDDDMKFFKGTTFKPSTKIKNSLICVRCNKNIELMGRYMDPMKLSNHHKHQIKFFSISF